MNFLVQVLWLGTGEPIWSGDCPQTTKTRDVAAKVAKTLHVDPPRVSLYTTAFDRVPPHAFVDKPATWFIKISQPPLAFDPTCMRMGSHVHVATGNLVHACLLAHRLKQAGVADAVRMCRRSNQNTMTLPIIHMFDRVVFIMEGTLTDLENISKAYTRALLRNGRVTLLTCSTRVQTKRLRITGTVKRPTAQYTRATTPCEPWATPLTRMLQRRSIA